MRNKFGDICMVLGAALVLAALSLFAYNQREASQAGQASIDLLPQLIEQIEQRQESQALESEESTGAALELPPSYQEPEDLEMTEVEIDGYSYIGYLSIPTLGLELPIMSDWSYAQLRIAPCRYFGSTKSDDLVLLAHNYTRHFGRLSELSEGDIIYFIDMDGVTTQYEVIALDVLSPTAVEQMTSGEYDLTLFTCTYGGKSRVTVYCDRV